jgi:ABC-type branched-subunit amino acid transport system permease subunit
VIELSTFLVITTSLVLLILAVLAVLFGLDEWIPTIRVAGLVFAIATSVWLLVTIWIIEFRHRRESK